jgi:hypothetical protein
MKYLKFTKVAAITVLLFSNLSFRTISTEDHFVEVYFSDKLDINNLSKLQSDLLEKNIKLNYDYLKFTKDGKLEEIEYDVTYEKVRGSDKTTDTHSPIGFIIDTNVNPKFGIIVGAKEAIQKRRMLLETQKK